MARFRLARRQRISITLALSLGLTASSATNARAALPMLGSKGVHLVDPAGKPVVLKGCNLGNWLILESWMFGGTLQSGGENFHDQASLFRTLDSRFGKERSRSLMNAFRDSYITSRDFDAIKTFGFNVVRVPFDYRLLQDDDQPTELRADAFQWLDRALDLAEAAGVYVILDMHGVPGGQSGQDHTGESDQNKLWHDAKDQQRTIDLWKAIANRYKGRGVVAAYDLINEPYSDYREDVRPVLATIMPRIADAIRGTGDTHVLYYSGALNGGIAFYGNPKEKGIADVGFTEHYYPGLFGSKPALETHARLIGQELPAKEAYVEQLGAPYFVGEFNIVLASEEPNRLMRAYYDKFAEYGWTSTMWSYKLVKPEAGAGPSAWYMATNGDPLPKLDVTKASADEIERFFKSLATTSLAVSEPLRDAITTKTPAPLYLAKYAPLPTEAPKTPTTELPGYASSDIGEKVTPGHTAARGANEIEVMAGGSDINGTGDSFRFVSKPAGGAGDVRATIASFVDTNEYAKAGPMARWGEGPNAAMAMINVFPDGTVALVSRPSDGAGTTEQKVAAGVALPVELRLQIDNGKATASYRSARGGEWFSVATADVPNGRDYRAGLAVCAHLDGVLTTVRATLGDAADNALPTAKSLDEKAVAEGKSLLKDGSFESKGASDDVPANWNRWGDWLNRETTWSPVRDGKSLIGYHHWQIDGAGGSSGLWQDVKVTPGQRYTFTIFVQHDAAEAGKHDAKTLELRLESTVNGEQVTLNSRDFTVDALATGKDWTRATVTGTAQSETLRALAVINAGDAPRGGAVKLDTATLTPAKDGK